MNKYILSILLFFTFISITVKAEDTNSDYINSFGKLYSYNIYLTYTNIDLLFQKVETQNDKKIQQTLLALEDISNSTKQVIDQLKKNDNISDGDAKLIGNIKQLISMLNDDVAKLKAYVKVKNATNRDKFIEHHKLVYKELQKIIILTQYIKE